MSNFNFSQRSKSNLVGVHPNLIEVVKRALELSIQDFVVTEGVRTVAKQKKLIKLKKSQTMRSKHLVQKDGYGYAVDLVAYPVSWDINKYLEIARAMQQSAKELNIKIRWGGCWGTLNQDSTPQEMLERYKQFSLEKGRKPFIDAPHFELSK